MSPFDPPAVPAGAQAAAPAGEAGDAPAAPAGEEGTAAPAAPAAVPWWAEPAAPAANNAGGHHGHNDDEDDEGGSAGLSTEPTVVLDEHGNETFDQSVLPPFPDTPAPPLKHSVQAIRYAYLRALLRLWSNAAAVCCCMLARSHSRTQNCRRISTD